MRPGELAQVFRLLAARKPTYRDRRDRSSLPIRVRLDFGDLFELTEAPIHPDMFQ
jgi:hypothetical protein